MLTNHLLRVYLDSLRSRWRKTNNGLLQELVLAPTQFNLYMSDLTKTEDIIFQFADNIAKAYQAMELANCERMMIKDLIILNTY